MSKLPLVDTKTFEKLLLQLGFKLFVKKEVMYSIVTRMADILLYRIIKEGMSAGL